MSMREQHPRGLRWRVVAGIAALAALAACNIDRMLEATVVPDTHLAMALDPSTLSLAQGETATITAAITRLGDYQGDVAFGIVDAPPGVGVQVGTLTTAGQVTRAVLTLTAGTSTAAGAYLITVRGTGGHNGVTTAQIALQVSATPTISLTPSATALTVIRGGRASVDVSIGRTSAPNPVTLALTGSSGISATFSSNPVIGGSATATMAVAVSVAPGVYTLLLRASSAGVGDREVPLTVTVPADSLQLIAARTSGLQASLASSDVIVNRSRSGDALTFSVEGLPRAVTASVSGGGTEDASARVTFAIGATAPTGSYSLTLRGRSALLGDAATPLALQIDTSRVVSQLAPAFLNLTPGSSATSTLTMTRTAFSGAVALDASTNVSGLNASVTPSVLTGNSAVIAVTAANSLAPGNYIVAVRTMPQPAGGAGTPALDPLTDSIAVIVTPAVAINARVVLDWSACAAPQWVAMQDGAGAWTSVDGAGGVYQFTLTTTRGAFAFVIGNSVTVRYGTASELAAAPVLMCSAPAAATKSVYGTAVHTGASEFFTWRFGGGSGSSTQATPDFAITGVREGTHDLVGIGTLQSGANRMLLQRDLSIPAGGSLGVVNLSGSGSFPFSSVTFTVAGFSAESATITTSYFTRASCTAAELRTTLLGATTGTASLAVFGVPSSQQRTDDFHMVDIVTSNSDGSSTRAYGLTFHTLAFKTLALPPVIAPTVQTLAGSHKRLQALLDASVAANYNDMFTLSFTDGARTSTVMSSMTSLGANSLVLAMPDLSDVATFPGSAAIASNASGHWTLSVTGASGQSRCADGAVRWSATRSGSY